MPKITNTKDKETKGVSSAGQNEITEKENTVGNKDNNSEEEPNYDILKWDAPETNSVSEEIRYQNSKAAKLPFKEKMKHFWYYYKIPFFVVLGVLAFAVYLILHYTVFAPKPYAFSAYALHSSYVKDITSDEETQMDRFLSDFNKYMNFDLTQTRSEINTEMTINPSSGDNISLAYDMNLTASAQAGDVDLITGSAELIDCYVPSGFYQDTIDKYLPVDFYEYLKANDLLYSYTDPTDSAKYEIGIYIKDAARMKDTGLYQDTDIKEPIAAIVTAHSPRIDTAVAFLEYLFDYPACADSK